MGAFKQVTETEAAHIKAFSYPYMSNYGVKSCWTVPLSCLAVNNLSRISILQKKVIRVITKEKILRTLEHYLKSIRHAEPQDPAGY
jgi:hypothetical protein